MGNQVQLRFLKNVGNSIFMHAQKVPVSMDQVFDLFLQASISMSELHMKYHLYSEFYAFSFVKETNPKSVKL